MCVREKERERKRERERERDRERERERHQMLFELLSPQPCARANGAYSLPP